MRGRLSLILATWLIFTCWGCASRRREADLDQLAPPANTADGTSISDWAPPPPVESRGAQGHNTTERAHAAYRQTEAAAAPGTLPPPDPQEIQQLVAALQSLGPLEPAENQRLMQTLRGTTPDHWSRIIEDFRASRPAQVAEVAPLQNVSQVETTAAPAVATPAVSHRDPALASEPQPVSTAATDTPAGLAVATDEIPSTEPTSPTAAEPALLEKAAAVTVTPIAATPAASEPKTPAETAAPVVAAADKETSAATAATTAASETPAEETKPEVIQATHESPAATPVSADAAMVAAITALEAEVVDSPATPEDFRRQQQLRMLYLAAGRRNDALRPLTGLPSLQQEYWSEQFYGLSVLLDETKTPDAAKRAAESREHLNQALVALGQEASLVVHRLNFCTEVNSFGVFTRMEKQEFTPGQELLLYAEVENFHAEPSREGYHTALKSSYQIFDSSGQRLAEHEFPITEEHCQNRRRDYFIRYFLSLPDRCYPGKHTLQLTIEDTLGKKIGQATIDFEVKEAGAVERKVKKAIE